MHPIVHKELEILEKRSTLDIPSTSLATSDKRERHMATVKDENQINTSTHAQFTITDAFKKVSSFKEGDNTNYKITQSIVFIICKNLESSTLVEREGFHKLMKTVAPLHTIPSRKTIRRAIIDKYNYMFQLLKEELKIVYSMCPTTDIWTDSQTRNFSSFTVHYSKAL